MSLYFPSEYKTRFLGITETFFFISYLFLNIFLEFFLPTNESIILNFIVVCFKYLVLIKRTFEREREREKV